VGVSVVVLVNAMLTAQPSDLINCISILLRGGLPGTRSQEGCLQECVTTTATNVAATACSVESPFQEVQSLAFPSNGPLENRVAYPLRAGEVPPARA
jgi:hypothetical protein